VTDYTVTQVDPSNLKPHPANKRIYGDSPDVGDEKFVESIRKGVLEPLLTTGDLTIISGHRRREAALIAGLSTVPVVVRPDLTDPLDVEEALILANQQRVKDNLQKAREFKRLQEIEAKRAASRKGRKKSGKVAQTKGDPTGRSIDIAAKKVGMAPGTARKAAKVIDEIDKAEASGDTAKAKDLSDKLKDNVAGAHRDATSKAKVPEKVPANLVKTFGSQSTYRSLVAKIGAIRKEIIDLSLEEGGERILIHNVRVEIKNLLEVLHASIPYAVCPYCDGGGCVECEEYGWMTRDRYSGIPKERR